MPTPVLLVDQDGNEATRMMSDAEINEALGGIVALPTDEALDKATCYVLPVQVTG